jgi:hypothetical protein
MKASPLSYSQDVSREEIVSRYRERIREGKRGKLGKTELEQLILHLIESLKTLAGQAQIKAICDGEISLLEEGYKTSTVAFDYLPKYRKAIEQAIAEGLIPLNEENSHRYVHSQRITGIEEERFEHYALSYLKYDEATYEGLDNRNKRNNRHKQLNLKGVNPERYLQQIQELLESEDRFQARHQAIAIAGLTGRRLNEVLARGQFSLSEHPFLLRFDGHSKTKRDAYDIVTLIEGDLLLPYLESFRELDEIQPLLTLSGEDLAIAVNKFDVQVNRECNKYLTGIVPPLEGRDAVSVHNLRGLWGAIAAYYFCPPDSHEYPFLQQYLGHALDSAATGHYFRYRLLDETGNYLEERGVKIPVFGELPLPSSLATQPDPSGVNETNKVDTTSPISEVIKVDESSRIPETTMPEKSELVLISSPDTAQDVDGNGTISEGGKSEPPSLSFLPSLRSHPLADSLQASLNQLLKSDRYTHRLTALMAVTGLKASALLKSRKFTPHPDDSFSLLFSSTIATSFETLRTLLQADSVLDAIADLKKHPDVQPLLYLSPNDIDTRCLPHVSRTIASHLPYKSLDEMFGVYRSLTNTPEPPQLEKPKRPPSTLYHIYSDDLGRIAALSSSLNLQGSQSDVFRSLLDWVEERLSSPVPTPDTVQALSHQAQTLAWLTTEISSLRQRVSSLEQERDDLKSRLDGVGTPEPEVASLRADNERLSSELAQANATLSMFRQLLEGSSPEPNKNTTERDESDKPDAKADKIEPMVSAPRRSRADGGARARTISIWNALQDWNLAHPDNTFAINAGLLETVFGIHRQAAHSFLEDFSEEIAEHHKAIGVFSPRSHNRSKDFSPLKEFVLSFNP